jgi:hypothetical protein
MDRIKAFAQGMGRLCSQVHQSGVALKIAIRGSEISGISNHCDKTTVTADLNWGFVWGVLKTIWPDHLPPRASISFRVF